MYWVYAIKSKERNYIYIGLTDNLKRRIKQHNNFHSKTTRPYAPFDLIHTEQFSTRIEARKREKELKSGQGKEYIKKNIKIIE